MASFSLRRQIGHDLADDAAELESVAGEPGREEDIRKARQGVDDEVLVRRVSEHAGLERHRRPVRVGKVAGDRLPQYRLILIAAVSIQTLGGGRFIKVVELANLETRYAERRRPGRNSRPPAACDCSGGTRPPVSSDIGAPRTEPDNERRNPAC